MIRTLIVDDDFMAVSVHRQFVDRVPGFEAVGAAATGAEALSLVARLAPDLILLDVYLPDMSGVEVLRRLRGSQGAPVDAIVITSAKDVDTLRDAMHLGVVHYIVKPFTFRTFRERFESYAVARTRLEAMHQAEQRDIDQLYGLLRTSTEESLPKNISAPTLALVARILQDSGGGVSAAELASRSGISQGIARRYLKFLTDSGVVDFGLRYGAAGRPEHLYRWAGPVPR